ncbi:MAG: hypothetical protein P4L40_15030 [Terracidiphilus sp.]|nr:hypothetical protein [Terracidiphilus sp.]
MCIQTSVCVCLHSCVCVCVCCVSVCIHPALFPQTASGCGHLASRS